jgi:hypothetical protein
MIGLSLLVLAVTASAWGSSSTPTGESFGPPQTLTCTWFTNFENSRFDRCLGAKGEVLRSSDGASIECQGKTCKQLDAGARRLTRSRKAEPPEGTFTVRLVGRISLYTHQPRYLGDGTRTVLVEKVLGIRKAK